MRASDAASAREAARKSCQKAPTTHRSLVLLRRFAASVAGFRDPARHIPVMFAALHCGNPLSQKRNILQKAVAPGIGGKVGGLTVQQQGTTAFGPARRLFRLRFLRPDNVDTL